LPWENGDATYPSTLASPLDIIIGASNGASDYGNKFGEPLIGGFARSFGLQLPGGDRWEFLKPIMWTGGVGAIDVQHMTKSDAEKGMLIVQIGGPAYRIGFGGGAASSLMQGDNAAHLDFNAVQRGDGEMKRKVDCVLQACIALGSLNPIVSIHDQGAGGPANVLKELVEKVGGRVELRNITVGDSTMSAVEIWVCEYQERNGLLISPARIDEFKSICAREKVNCEVLGEVTGDGRFVVHDKLDDSTPVDFELARVLGGMPQKTFSDNRVPMVLEPFRLPEGTTVAEALDRVLCLLDVCSKGFLVHKVDRSVGGLVVRQQCCGPLQLPVADNAISALSHFGLSGSVTAIGEQPIKMLIDSAKGARMAVGEALTNMASAHIGKLGDIKCSANWMWAAKLPGEGAAMWDAAIAMADLMIGLGIAPNRGKDSLSMATRVGNETVKSCRELVVYAYAPTPDVTKHVTPDIKRPGKSTLIHVDLANGKRRLGGSALAHVYGQIGNESPDVDNPEVLKYGFEAVQQLVSEGSVLAMHDISDGGLIVTLLEMAFAGNCGIEVNLASRDSFGQLFAEELGWVIECDAEDAGVVMQHLYSFSLHADIVGYTTKHNYVSVVCDSEEVLYAEMSALRQTWEETSYQLERQQTNVLCAEQEMRNGYVYGPGPQYRAMSGAGWLPVIPVGHGPKVMILREEGSNGYREMAAAFFAAGFDPWDVTMTDLLEGRISLDGFRGLAAVGGFSYADVPASAKGWAATIRFNPRVKEMFEQFYARTDTFSLGVCNGCQLFGLLGTVPWAGIPDKDQPRFVRNTSGRFESRWSTALILPGPSIMLSGMEGSVLGVWTAHGEGRLECPNPEVLEDILFRGLAPVRYVDDSGRVTESYPFNPNGSPEGITALCTPDGRHLAMMPHPERVFLDRQWSWMPDELKSKSGFSPWLRMFVNAREWCEQNG
jgi:phosphoribosylformylglycinamidine synthase